MKHLTRHMTHALALVHGWTDEEKGATATEYSILVGFIALVIVAAVSLFGIALDDVFAGLATGLQAALSIP